MIVKLTRTLMIIPICVALGAFSGRSSRACRERSTDRRTLPWRRMVPLFLIGFLVASALDAVGAITTAWHGGLATTSTFLITVRSPGSA